MERLGGECRESQIINENDFKKEDMQRKKEIKKGGRERKKEPFAKHNTEIREIGEERTLESLATSL